MPANRYRNFDYDFFYKYATLSYCLSKAASSNVYGPIQWNDKQLAIKQVTIADAFKKDIEVKNDSWTSLEHKHLIRIHSVNLIHSVELKQLPKAMFILMEFAAGGSLHKTLRSLEPGNKLPIDVVTDWAKQIAEGMLYLHQKNIVHRDLKSSNILLMEPFAVPNSHVKVALKISDFDGIKVHDQTTIVSSFAYMAPEVLVSQWFTKASDVWSYGVVIWEILSVDIPHKGLKLGAISLRSTKGALPLEQSFPADYKLLLNKCWESAYQDRPSFSKICCVLERMAERQDDIQPPKRKHTESDNCQDELPEKYQSDPILIKKIRTKAAEEDNKSICGLTILDKELFVVSKMSSEVEVYDSMKLSFNRQLNLKRLIYPKDIVSCNRNKCLYIIDYGSLDKWKKILRVDPNIRLIGEWSTGRDYGRLSVTEESNVILTVFENNKLNEYSPDGQLIREINLSSDAGIRCPWHAIIPANGHFMVSHGDYGDDLHRVCIVDIDGKLMKSFGGKHGSNSGEMNLPVHFFIDGNGFVFVIDQGNSRVLLLDSNLKLKKEILSEEKQGLQHPWTILLDESSSRMLVADNKWGCGGRILIFQFSL